MIIQVDAQTYINTHASTKKHTRDVTYKINAQNRNIKININNIYNVTVKTMQKYSKITDITKAV